MNLRRYADHPFWQAVGIVVAAYAVIVYVVPLLPGSALVPKSVVLQYMATVLVGVLIYVSDNEERWASFREPIHAALVEPRLRLVRAGLLVAVPALVGLVAYGQVRTTVAAPPFVTRTIESLCVPAFVPPPKRRSRRRCELQPCRAPRRGELPRLGRAFAL